MRFIECISEVNNEFIEFLDYLLTNITKNMTYIVFWYIQGHCRQIDKDRKAHTKTEKF